MNDIHMRESTQKLYRYTGFASLAAGVLMLIAGLPNGALFCCVGAFQLVFVANAGRNPLIRISHDHLEIKLAPLASKQFVAFGEIHRVERNEKKLILHTRARQVVIPVKAIDDSALQHLTRVLRIRAHVG